MLATAGRCRCCWGGTAICSRSRGRPAAWPARRFAHIRPSTIRGSRSAAVPSGGGSSRYRTLADWPCLRTGTGRIAPQSLREQAKRHTAYSWNSARGGCSPAGWIITNQGCNSCNRLHPAITVHRRDQHSISGGLRQRRQRHRLPRPAEKGLEALQVPSVLFGCPPYYGKPHGGVISG